jgi:hypothetical protein
LTASDDRARHDVRRRAELCLDGAERFGALATEQDKLLARGLGRTLLSVSSRPGARGCCGGLLCLAHRILDRLCDGSLARSPDLSGNIAQAFPCDDVEVAGVSHECGENEGRVLATNFDFLFYVVGVVL